METPAPGEVEAVTYYSPVDWWIALVLSSPLLLGFYLLVTGKPDDGMSAISVGLALWAFVILIVVPCRYTLTDRHLVIRCGVVGFLFKQKIDLGKITGASLTYNPLAAPATSINRIEIKYEGGFCGFTLISPRDREGFIRELNRRREMLK